MVVTFNITRSVAISVYSLFCGYNAPPLRHTADLAATLSRYYHLNDRMRGLMLSETNAQSCQRL